MDWEHPFTRHEGDINRSRFRPGIGAFLAGAIFASIIDNAIGTTFISLYYGFVYMVYVIAMISCVFAVCTKSRRDRDKSGWWSLIRFVPFIGANRLIVERGILEGTLGANRFGSDPLA